MKPGFFAGCSNPDQMRALYRDLVKAHHPDRGGDGRLMQQINDEYHAMLRSMDGREYRRTTTSADGRETWKYQYNEAQEKEIAEALARVVDAIGTAPNVNIHLVGIWLWISGETRPIKDQLKGAGCWWNSKRGAWNWHPTGTRSRFNKNVELDDILASGVKIPRPEYRPISA